MGLRRFLAAFLCASAAAATAAAECVYAPDLANYASDAAAVGSTGQDRTGRVVAPVSVNGQGPFRFIVDTGANRSVISQGLAEALGLAPAGAGDVHSVYGVTRAPLVEVSSLRYGQLALDASTLPTLQGGVLAGADGLLGVDGMRGRRLRMDFVGNCIEIVPSEGARRLRRGWTMMRGEMRFGHLVVIPGRIGDVNVNLFLDTGSDSTLANIALRDALDARHRRSTTVQERTTAYTAGRPVVLDDAILVPRIRMGSHGEVQVRDITAYVGDFHIFRLWELHDEPTLLIGMDVLSQTRELAIDYARGTVYMRARGNEGLGVVFTR